MVQNIWNTYKHTLVSPAYFFILIIRFTIQKHILSYRISYHKKLLLMYILLSLNIIFTFPIKHVIDLNWLVALYLNKFIQLCIIDYQTYIFPKFIQLSIFKTYFSVVQLYITKPRAGTCGWIIKQVGWFFNFPRLEGHNSCNEKRTIICPARTHYWNSRPYKSYHQTFLSKIRNLIKDKEI